MNRKAKMKKLSPADKFKRRLAAMKRMNKRNNKFFEHDTRESQGNSLNPNSIAAGKSNEMKSTIYKNFSSKLVERKFNNRKFKNNKKKFHPRNQNYPNLLHNANQCCCHCACSSNNNHIQYIQPNNTPSDEQGHSILSVVPPQMSASQSTTLPKCDISSLMNYNQQVGLQQLQQHIHNHHHHQSDTLTTFQQPFCLKEMHSVVRFV